MLILGMDSMSGDILLGFANATLKNGATVIPGIVGGALYIPGNGSYANFGSLPHGCMHYPGNCTLGATFSFWVRFYAWQVNGIGLVINNGGCWYESTGFCFWQMPDSFGFSARLVEGGHNYVIKNVTLYTWHFITGTYKNGIILLYHNGCIAPFSSRSTWVRSHNLLGVYPLTAGSPRVTSYSPHMALDQLLIWDTELPADDVWELYKLGGITWTISIYPFWTTDVNCCCHWISIPRPNIKTVFRGYEDSHVKE